MDKEFQEIIANFPEDYFVSNEAIFKEIVNATNPKKNRSIMIANNLVFITGKIEILESGQLGYYLSFKAGGSIRKIEVTRNEVSITSELLKLANKGVPVNSANCMALVEFLSHQAAAADPILTTNYYTEKSGWFKWKEAYYFGYGSIVIGKAGTQTLFRKMPYEVSNEINYVGTRAGTIERWIEAIKILKRHPLALFTFGCSLAAPLLYILKVPGFTMHLQDDSTNGKTINGRAAVSIYGDPADGALMRTWEGSLVGLIGRAIALNHLIAPLDDSSLAGSPYLIEHLLYAIGNSSTKARGTQTGGSRDAKSFQVIGISNGESVLLDETSKTGQAVRTIQIKGSPWLPDSSSDILKIEELLKENYGFFGERYLQHLVDVVNDKHKYDSLKDEFSFQVQQTKLVSSNKFVARTAPMISIVKVALDIAKELLPELHLSDVDIRSSIDAIIQHQNENLNYGSTTAFKAYCYVIDQIQANQSKFTPEEREIWGYRVSKKTPLMQVGGFAFIKSQLSKVLKAGGFEPSSVINQFKKNKWIWIDDTNQLYPIKAGGTTARLPVFDFETAREAGVFPKLTAFEEKEGGDLI